MYYLYVMSFDGDHIEDSHHKTIEQAEKTINDFGSKWFFYPWSIITDENGKIIEVAGAIQNIETKKPILTELFVNKCFSELYETFQEFSELTNGDYDLPEIFEHELIDYVQTVKEF